VKNFVVLFLSLLLLSLSSCTPSDPSVPTTPSKPGTTPTQPVTLTPGLGRANTLAMGYEARVIVWLKTDGSVWQNIQGVVSQVAGITESKAIGLRTDSIYVTSTSYTGVVVTKDGTVWTWAVGAGAATPTKVGQIESGAADVVVDAFMGLVLGNDGRVWKLEFSPSPKLSSEPVATDVMAVRLRGFLRRSAGQEDAIEWTNFLKTGGTAQFVESYPHAPDFPPTVEDYGQGLLDVGIGGVTQEADGKVYLGLGEYLVHDLRAKYFESSMSSRAVNSTTSSSSLALYTLFPDGGLWETVVTNTQGENQQGAPTSSANVTQTLIKVGTFEDVIDFDLVERGGLVVWTNNGTYLSNRVPMTTDNPYGFERLELSDLRRPSQ
jgi:hypothetical protein